MSDRLETALFEIEYFREQAEQHRTIGRFHEARKCDEKRDHLEKFVRMLYMTDKLSDQWRKK